MKRRAYAFVVANALVMGALAVTCSIYLGIPLRDPDGFLGPAWVRLPLLLAGAFAVDVLPRSLWRSRGHVGALRREAGLLIREHWTRDRIVLVVVGLISFYVTYVSYRNLKNFLPFLRSTRQNDYLLHDVDLWLFGGSDPALLLHSLLGTGVTAHVLSWVYLIFLPLVPISVAAWLVWSRNVSFGWWFVTADCLCWTLGTASYYILPTLGPNFFFPWLYGDLPVTGVSGLQDGLASTRAVLRFNPFLDGVQSVAGFASLHVALTVMMALVGQYTLRNRLLKTVLWVDVVLTALATSYFGWHYLADDVAGLAIALVSFYIAALATGQKFDRHGRSSHPTTSTGDVPVDADV